MYEWIPGWERVRERYRRFWELEEPLDRPVMQVQVHVDAGSTPAWPVDNVELHLDPRRAFERRQHYHSCWHYTGDLYPYFVPGWGPNLLASLLGGKVEFTERTAWIEPVWDELEAEARIERDGIYWQALANHTRFFIEKLRGKSPLGWPDFGGIGDVIGALYGTQNMLLALAERPGRVKEAADRVASCLIEAHETVYEMTAPHFDGTSNWMPLWCHRKCVLAADDCMTMISPELYEKVFFEATERFFKETCADYRLLHFHNGAASYAGLLAESGLFDAIQWGIDPGCPVMQDLGALKRLQRTGVRVFVGVLQPEEVEPLLRGLSPRGLLLLVQAPDDQAAKGILKLSEAFCK